MPIIPSRSHLKTPAQTRLSGYAVITLAAHNPDTGCRRLSLNFNRYYVNSHRMTVSKTFVADLLKKHRYAITQKRRIPAPIAKN